MSSTSTLNRPSVLRIRAPPLTTSGFTSDFRLDDSTHVWSGMLNGLVDFGGQEGVGGYLGAGAGYASVHAFGASNGKFAWQLIGGVYYPVSNNDRYRPEGPVLPDRQRGQRIRHLLLRRQPDRLTFTPPSA